MPLRQLCPPTDRPPPCPRIGRLKCLKAASRCWTNAVFEICFPCGVGNKGVSGLSPKDASAHVACFQVLHAGQVSGCTKESEPLEAGHAQMCVRVVPRAHGSVFVLERLIETPFGVHEMFCALAAMISAPLSAK